MHRPTAMFRVSSLGHDCIYPAKSAGSAARKFFRQFNITPTTDPDTRGWKGISINCVGKVK